MNLLVIFAVVAFTFVWSEDQCECLNFMGVDGKFLLPMRNSPEHTTDCQDVAGCAAFCANLMNEITNNGDLESIVNIEGYTKTVGDLGCFYISGLAGVHKAYMEGYSKLCHNPWTKTGFEIKGPFCCFNGTHSPNYCV